ncbi:MAG: glycine cleavage system aminomethyltransferase GcvT [Candidatus Scalindua sp.]|nr:glycine cleavage system aminomethyltransferase GcvT [Candidatus Scalindua sp.]
MTENKKKTPLYNAHVNLGARINDYHDFLMPILYDSIISEHQNTRCNASLFDISHMGEIVVEGEGATELIQQVITNDVSCIRNYQALYTPICNVDGGILDDIIVFKFLPEKYLLVVNCINTDRDYDWIKKFKTNATSICNISEQIALLAVQGPKSEEIIRDVYGDECATLPRFQFTEITHNSIDLTISRTGYTGEDGFEIFVNQVNCEKVWNTLLEKGKHLGLKPAGLGARNTLRLEAGLSLYGNDINESTSPFEANMGWAVKFNKPDFIGKDSLSLQRTGGIQKKLIAFKMHDKGIPRTNNEITHDNKVIGKVTSGTFSPTLKIGIGLGSVLKFFAEPNSHININIRGKSYAATIVHTPFIKKDKQI